MEYKHKDPTDHGFCSFAVVGLRTRLKDPFLNMVLLRPYTKKTRLKDPHVFQKSSIKVHTLNHI